MKIFRVCIFFFMLFAPLGSAIADTGLLPHGFGGWQLMHSVQSSNNPASVDPANAALLKEYGFVNAATATYTRDDGRKLTLKAAGFQDASGAYGAFTFYRTAQMQKEEIGDQAASFGPRVLFFRGKILIDAVFDHLSEMSAAELRELSDDLPATPATDAKLPDLPAYLPKESLVANSAKYVVGPLALEKVGGLLPSQYVDFEKGPEVVLGDYKVSGQDGKLMLVAYPTAQIAAGQLKEIEAAEQAHPLSETPLALRRTGRILVVAGGSLSSEVAKTMVSSVNYDADVTWNQNTYHNPKDNVGRVVLGGIVLSAILIGALLVSSIAFGGFRVAMNRFMPGKVFNRPEEVEIIGLHLSDAPHSGSETGVSSSIKAG